MRREIWAEMSDIDPRHRPSRSWQNDVRATEEMVRRHPVHLPKSVLIGDVELLPNNSAPSEEAADKIDQQAKAA